MENRATRSRGKRKVGAASGGRDDAKKVKHTEITIDPAAGAAIFPNAPADIMRSIVSALQLTECPKVCGQQLPSWWS